MMIMQVINISANPQDTGIKLAGAGRAYAGGSALTMIDADPLAENTYAEPFKIAPVETALAFPAAGATEFRHTFPPYSVTVLRLHPARQ